MSTLELVNCIDRPDDVYAAIAHLTADVDEAEALKRQAKLILFLATQIGKPEIVIACARLAAGEPASLVIDQISAGSE